MSGFLGQMLGGLLGGGGTIATVGSLLTPVLGTAEGATGGGLPALLAQFENAGLGEHVKSWLGSGENLPLTAEHVVAAIPPEQLTAWAEKIGVPADQVPGLLASVLPHAVDHATADGTVPEPGTPVPDMSTLLGKLLKP